MNPKKRFFLGGGGALMPVIVSLLAVDIGAAINNEVILSTGIIIGFAFRYIILFLVGGVVAYLHEDEIKPFKLFELGIAAPALITSLITAQGVISSAQQTNLVSATYNSIAIVRSAYADDTFDSSNKKIVLAGGLFNDILRGATGSVYRDFGKSTEKPSHGTTKTAGKAAKDSGKSSDKAEQNTDKPTKRTNKDIDGNEHVEHGNN